MFEDIYTVSLIDYHMQALTNSKVKVIGSETVKGVECFTLKLTPNMEQLMDFGEHDENIGTAMFYFTDIDDAEGSFKKFLENFSIRQWVAKDTYYLMKAEVQLNLEYRKSSCLFTKNLLIYHQNESLDISLPSEAE